MLLLDSLGELSQLYALASVVFVGGSLVPSGGHNILEPAVAGKPVVVGPHMENFQEIADQFRAEEALVQVASADELAGAGVVAAARRGPSPPARRARAGARGPQPRRGRAQRRSSRRARPVRRLLGSLFASAASLRVAAYERGLLRRARLAGPVVSVGNLSVGGSGKTPVVRLVAELLREAGAPVAVLSRGYGGRFRGDALVVGDGRAVTASAEEAGDEPVMLARALPGVVVAVGRRRDVVGRAVEARFGRRVHVLDDGFQHLRLARDLDLVCLDVADLDDRPLPAGRLRERPAALVAGVARAPHARRGGERGRAAGARERASVPRAHCACGAAWSASGRSTARRPGALRARTCSRGSPVPSGWSGTSRHRASRSWAARSSATTTGSRRPSWPR